MQVLKFLLQHSATAAVGLAQRAGILTAIAVDLFQIVMAGRTEILCFRYHEENIFCRITWVLSAMMLIVRCVLV